MTIDKAPTFRYDVKRHLNQIITHEQYAKDRREIIERTMKE